jgi:hypothetical protein
MTVHILKSDFTRGVLHPLAHARQEAPFYQSCVQELENFLIVKFGGIRRRSGTRYCGAAKNANRTATLIPFQFSASQVYFIELGHLYFRVWTAAGGLVLNGGSPVEVVTPYEDTEVGDVQYEQSGDTIFLAHPNHPPARIVRVSNTNWTYNAVAFVDGPYGPLNDTAVTLSISTSPIVNSNPTLTFSNVSAVNNGAGLTSQDVGRHIRFQTGGNYAWGTITSVSNTTTCVANIKESAASGTAATPTWRLGLLAPSQGYFGCVSFYQGRLVWARTPAKPRAIAFSQANTPFRYTPSALAAGTVTDDHGFSLELFSGKADEISWLQENINLQIGTASAIRTIGPQDNSTAFGPRNYRERLEVGTGVSAVAPVSAGPSTVHVGRFGVTLKDLFYDYQVDSLVAPELSTLSQHLLVSGIKQLAHCDEPASLVWALLSNGQLVAMTYERYDKVIALHPHTVSGVVEAIASAPNFTGRYDALMMVVRRTVNEQTVRYVEVLQPDFVNQSQEDAWFVDCGARYEGAPANVITDLEHLAGEIVAIFADGAVLPKQQVSPEGTITLPNNMTAEKVLVGLPMVSRAKFLRLQLQARDGFQLGLEKRTPYVVLDLFETSGLQIGAADRYEIVNFRKPSDPMNKSPGLFTGTKRTIIDPGWALEGQLELLADSVLPATIRAANFGVQD